MAVVATPDACFQQLQTALDQVNAQVLAATDLTEKRVVRAMKKRLQDRLYQRKLRAKREYKIRSLEHDVQTLETKIARLYLDLNRRKAAVANAETQRQQQLQRPNGSLQDHARSLVMQFFRVYQNGYSLPFSGLQERFLRSILTTDVEGVDLRGADAFVQQWRLYDQHFAQYVLEPQIWKTQDVGDQCVMVEVEVMLYLRCHRQTIGTLFPRLKTGQVDPELVLPLVTGTTAVAGTYMFVVDRTGHVSNLLVNLQLLETLRRVLGSLQNVVQLTDGGRIALDSGTITVA
ncbi:Alternative oxidase [Phytophthora nicotianae]|uniref:Alternative oxidase n=2 Tax=Phytophthora nicotianae TaxID=4792 RepID=A0A0W8DGS4_PHYNI|nr:Alternative oxidase [Phytophthora nicotianae]